MNEIGQIVLSVMSDSESFNQGAGKLALAACQANIESQGFLPVSRVGLDNTRTDALATTRAFKFVNLCRNSATMVRL